MESGDEGMAAQIAEMRAELQQHAELKADLAEAHESLAAAIEAERALRTMHKQVHVACDAPKERETEALGYQRFAPRDARARGGSGGLGGGDGGLAVAAQGPRVGAPCPYIRRAS